MNKMPWIKTILLTTVVTLPAHAIKDNPQEWDPSLKARVIDHMACQGFDANTMADDIIKADWDSEKGKLANLDAFRNWKKSIGPVKKENELADANLIHDASKTDILAALMADTTHKASSKNTIKTIQLLIHLVSEKAGTLFDNGYFNNVVMAKDKANLEGVFNILWKDLGLDTIKGDLGGKDQVHKIHCFQLGILGYVEKIKTSQNFYMGKKKGDDDAAGDTAVLDHLSHYLTSKGVTSVTVKDGGKKDISAFVKHCHNLIKKHSDALKSDYVFATVNVSQKFFKVAFGLEKLGAWNDEYKVSFDSAKKTWAKNLEQMRLVWKKLSDISQLPGYKDKGFMPGNPEKGVFDDKQWDKKDPRADHIAVLLRLIYQGNIFSGMSDGHTTKDFVDATTALLFNTKEMKDSVMKAPLFQPLEDHVKGKNVDDLVKICDDIEKSETQKGDKVAKIKAPMDAMIKIFRDISEKKFHPKNSHDVVNLKPSWIPGWEDALANLTDKQRVSQLIQNLLTVFINDAYFQSLSEFSKNITYFEKAEQDILDQIVALAAANGNEAEKIKEEGQKILNARKESNKNILDVRNVYDNMMAAGKPIENSVFKITHAQVFKDLDIGLKNLEKYDGCELRPGMIIYIVNNCLSEDLLKDKMLDQSYEDNVQLISTFEDTIVKGLEDLLQLKVMADPDKKAKEAIDNAKKKMEGFRAKRQANLDKQQKAKETAQPVLDIIKKTAVDVGLADSIVTLTPAPAYLDHKGNLRDILRGATIQSIIEGYHHTGKLDTDKILELLNRVSNTSNTSGDKAYITWYFINLDKNNETNKKVLGLLKELKNAIIDFLKNPAVRDQAVLGQGERIEKLVKE